MTEDKKVTRLSKAAREFNVGISTIVEFLHKKGYDLDPNSNTKLPQEAYELLVKEYSSDLSVKKESEKLILKDLHRKKESLSIEDSPDKPETEEGEQEDEVMINDTSGVKKTVDIKTEYKKPDIKLVGKIDLEKLSKPKNIELHTEKTKEPVTKPIVHKETIEQAPAEEINKKEIKTEKVVPEETEKQKTNIDLHIVGKIDLDTIAKDTKPVSKKGDIKEKNPGSSPKET